LPVRPDEAFELLVAAATEIYRAPVPLPRGSTRKRVLPAVLLIGILTGQACLSVQLLHLDTVFADEALYLWAGHMDWTHLIHGTSIPPFATYLSGSPLFYPPIGAIADSIGGLAGARILSLLFMLTSTGLLWLTGRRLHGLIGQPHFVRVGAVA
jgi:hypothetical protein